MRADDRARMQAIDIIQHAQQPTAAAQRRHQISLEQSAKPPRSWSHPVTGRHGTLLVDGWYTYDRRRLMAHRRMTP